MVWAGYLSFWRLWRQVLVGALALIALRAAFRAVSAFFIFGFLPILKQAKGWRRFRGLVGSHLLT
jgi:hypothetical protein